jgi:hypothetical protein
MACLSALGEKDTQCEWLNILCKWIIWPFFKFWIKLYLHLKSLCLFDDVFSCVAIIVSHIYSYCSKYIIISRIIATCECPFFVFIHKKKRVYGNNWLCVLRRRHKTSKWPTETIIQVINSNTVVSNRYTIELLYLLYTNIFAAFFFFFFFILCVLKRK